MSVATAGTRSATERASESLRRLGNPFRNYFARNPDDDVCTRYHVPELYAPEREKLLAVVDLYRVVPNTHSEIVPILGNKGAGKTHLLHSIKHGPETARQMLVTPGTYQKDSDFLEYLLFQVIDTLLGGGKQKGSRPLEFVGEELTRRLICEALTSLTQSERLDLFPAPGLGRWTRRFGLGATQAQERTQWLIENLQAHGRQSAGLRAPGELQRVCTEAGLEADRAWEMVNGHIERCEAHDTAGLMRRHIHQGFARAVLKSDESELANFLTYGFAELEFHVRPSRQDLVLALFKVLMEVFRGLKIPVVAAFDQLEDLLLARRTDDGHRVAEAFFAGIVQAMHQIDGICFLVFAERGLWNRFVPSLDGYIQDRLNNPIHLPEHGTIKALRLEAPSPDLVRRVVEARLQPALEELSDISELSPIYPFTEEQIVRVARTEPTLRDMLQQFRHLFDHLVYGAEPGALSDAPSTIAKTETLPSNQLPPGAKSVVIVESPAGDVAHEGSGVGDQESVDGSSPHITHHSPLTPSHSSLSAPHIRMTSEQFTSWGELWELTMRDAQQQLEPEGALTGATRELQAGLGAFLQVCHEHGVKVGPWRLQHVVGELSFGDHPTYGVVTIAHWVCRDSQPWKVGIGLFMGRGPGKPKDLEIKLASMEATPSVIDHLILLRPEDDLTLSGKSKTLWQEAERRGRHARLEPVSLPGFAVLYGFPRWLAAVTEGLPQGQPVPNLADLIQDRCDKLLEQVCMPVQQ
ncbi:MAG TPA: hypothetical protein VGX70_22635 [Gemmataceae bacterium]|jgi:hypothetical protein|nr:hypothetical protein [Gemmataceae bacterium]